MNASSPPAPSPPLPSFLPPLSCRRPKCILVNIASLLSIASVGDETVAYRLLRVVSLANVFYLGMFSREGVLAVATGWPSPMRLSTFVQCFGTTYYCCASFAGMPFTLLQEGRKAK